MKIAVGYLFLKDLSHNFSHSEEEIVVGYVFLRDFLHSFLHPEAWLNHAHSVPASMLLLSQG